MSTLSYNKYTKEKFGWEFKWLDLEDEDWAGLDSAVRDFQKNTGIKQDGYLGPMTFTRLVTDYEYRTEAFNQYTSICVTPGYFLPFKHKVTHHFDEFEAGKNYKKVNYRNNIKAIVTHWDAALSANSCKNILKRRGISTHFCIDNDGTIQQYVPLRDIAWHVSGHNDYSIGIDISNAYYLKYQDYYENNFGPRPVIESTVHGWSAEHLGWYDVQIKAYKKLVGWLCDYYEIPLEYPKDEDGKLVTTTFGPAQNKEFSGVMCHYHLDRNKIDTSGLELDKIIKELRDA